jgi:hypothetical protein
LPQHLPTAAAAAAERVYYILFPDNLMELRFIAFGDGANWEN